MDEGTEARIENRTIDHKYIVHYGLYVGHESVSAKFAERTGFSDNDMIIFWDALRNMFEHDRSAARGEMSARKLVVFEHDCALGRASAHDLFERVSIYRTCQWERSLSDW